MSTCQERVISRPQEGGRLDSMAPSGLFQLCDSDSDSEGPGAMRRDHNEASGLNGPLWSLPAQ